MYMYVYPFNKIFSGGTVTTVSGSGFASDAVVQVDGVDATVIQSQPGEITFYTPKSVSFGNNGRLPSVHLNLYVVVIM